MTTRRRVTMIVGVVLFLGGGAFALAALPGGSAANVVMGPAIFMADRKDLEVLAEAPGTAQPMRVVEVKSRASGEVLAVHVEVGDRVAQGQLLAEIDPRDVQNALDQAVADLESAEVLARTTVANRTRMEVLLRGGVVTEQEYEGVLQAAASAGAGVVRARTNLRLARERRGDVTIRAPVTGTILAGDAEPGQIIASATSNVSGGTILFTMADLSEMEVRTLVAESDIGQIVPGQSARVTAEAHPGRIFEGEVYRIEPLAVVEQNVTTFPVLVRIANPEGLLMPGMNAEVAVEIAVRSGVVVVPNPTVVAPRDIAAAAEALGLEGGPLPPGPAPTGANRPGVLFVRGAEGVEARTVVLGVSDWQDTEVVAGLEEGEVVLDASAAMLQQAQSREVGNRRPTGGVLGGGRIPGAGG